MKQNKQWSKEEWEEMRSRLQKLSLIQLREIANKTGLSFSIGNEHIEDKMEFVNALDESDRTELEKAYKEVIKMS